ncbi:hypothetical protein DSECCO2_288780 [anaerobic digester metagenome]
MGRYSGHARDRDEALSLDDLRALGAQRNVDELHRAAGGIAGSVRRLAKNSGDTAELTIDDVVGRDG